MVAEGDGAAEGHALFGHRVFVNLDVYAAEVGLTAHALRLEYADAGLDAAGAAFIAVAVHGGVFVDEVRGDVHLLGDADVAVADLREVGQALTMSVAETTATIDADADGRVFAA